VLVCHLAKIGRSTCAEFDPPKWQLFLRSLSLFGRRLSVELLTLGTLAEKTRSSGSLPREKIATYGVYRVALNARDA
jgi:hypothetical protein